MSGHVLDWLGTYYDGELHGDRLAQVEAHLSACAVCRSELEALEGLSVLLQESPAMPARTAPERFVAQVRLRLPPQPAPPDRVLVLRAVWSWLPLGVLGLWAFVQAVLVVSGLVLLTLPWISSPPGMTARDWSTGLGAIALVVLDTGLTAVTAVLVGGWLAGWWAARQRSLRASGEMAG